MEYPWGSMECRGVPWSIHRMLWSSMEYTRIANLRRCAGLWVSTKFNLASLQILYVHVYAIDIERKRH